jgi:hypothetical protein
VKRFPIYETNLLSYQDSPGGKELSSSSSVSPALPKLNHAVQSTNIIPYSFQDSDLSSFHNLVCKKSVLYTLGRGTFSALPGQAAAFIFS